ncbi:MAG TPA: sigma-70 family RNA polymerase sigma factor [Frankiaceae bacterium]|nr:sigma-70 family RNA polymerase sigma factor [Frankiaceae bacterium]
MSSYAEHPAAGSPDGLLVRAYLNGDPTAFDTLYERYSARILGYLYGKCHGDRLSAEELAQETWTRVLEYLPGFDQRRRLLPYLYTIATNLLPAYWRRTAVEVSVEDIRDSAPAVPDDTERIVTIAAVNEALAKIDKRHSAVLYMRYAEDRDAAELAEFFGLKRNAFEQLLLRARRAMKNEYRGPAVLVPGLPGLLARLRRLGATAGARLQMASGATVSVAGELAIGAAITAGGIGLVIHGSGANAADGRLARPAAVSDQRGAIAYEHTARDLYSGLPRGVGDVAAGVPGAAGTSDEALAAGAEVWDTGVEDGSTATTTTDGTSEAYTDGGVGPAGTAGGVPGVQPATPWTPGGDTPDAPDGTLYVAPPNVNAPAPDAEVYANPDGESGASVESDETSGEVALNRKIAEEGEIVTQEAETQVGETPLTLETWVYTNDFSVCYETTLC